MCRAARVCPCPRPRLAQAVRAEWQAAGGGKGGEACFDELPLTRLAGTMQERVRSDPGAVALAIARYGESDLLCYRATGPDVLVRREAEAWDPWLDWAADRYGARLRVASGIVHVAQEPEALATLAAAVAAESVPVLAALGVAVPALGSVVLGLAMAERALDADSAYALSVVDAEFQAELWGRDAEAEAARCRRAGRCRAGWPVHGVVPAVSARRVVITGRVHGVGYRDWLVSQACALGVSGWVRNRRDGGVEALFDGDEAAVEELLRLCRRGPLARGGGEHYRRAWPSRPSSRVSCGCRPAEADSGRPWSRTGASDRMTSLS